MQSPFIIKPNKSLGSFTVWDPRDFDGHGPQALGFVTHTSGSKPFTAKNLCGDTISCHATKGAAGRAVFQHSQRSA